MICQFFLVIIHYNTFRAQLGRVNQTFESSEIIATVNISEDQDPYFNSEELQKHGMCVNIAHKSSSTLKDDDLQSSVLHDEVQRSQLEHSDAASNFDPDLNE